MAAKAIGANASNKQERLQRLIECPVCLNELQDPRLLKCRHALCYTCLKDYKVKNEYVKELPCPVCREVTALYKGGVDNLPKFFFMNELKEVVMEEEEIKEQTPQKLGSVVCSTDDCGEVAVNFCTKGCEFLCQECVDEHDNSRRTKSHQVIGVSEGKELMKRNEPPYPPCHRHSHQHMDMYCLKCDQPICNTCSNTVHEGHKRCELERQGVECKKKLEETSKDTDRLINYVKQVMEKTKQQARQAEIDLGDICENVKSTFKAMRDNLDQEEKRMLLDIQNVRRRVQKTVAVTTDSQVMTLATLESMKSCQVKLVDKNRVYDYVTATESIQRDVESHITDLPGFMWTCEIIKKSKTDEMIKGRVEMKQSELEQTQEEEVGRIRLHVQGEANSVLGMVVYKERVYVVHYSCLVIYCYNDDGSLSEKYEHESGAETVVQGMCMMKHENTARLVVSDFTNKALVWITISDGGAMKHHHTQQVDYKPCASYYDRGHLMVCNVHHKIYRYTDDGQALHVITLPGDVTPRWVTRHGDSDHYVITDLNNHQVAVIDSDGCVKRRYKDDIHGVKLDRPYNITTDKRGRILVVDKVQNHILQISKVGEVKQLLQDQVKEPTCVCLDEEWHKMYVAAKYLDGQRFVFVYDYNVLTGGRKFTEKITRLDMVTVM